jgi:hypothetical protein
MINTEIPILGLFANHMGFLIKFKFIYIIVHNIYKWK